MGAIIYYPAQLILYPKNRCPEMSRHFRQEAIVVIRRIHTFVLSSLFLCCILAGPVRGAERDPFVTEPFTPFSFIHVSDFHLGGEPEIERRIARVGEIAKNTGAAFILVTGDQKPYDLQYFKNLMDKLPVPYYLVPGNHDLDQSTASLALYCQVLGPDYYSFTYHNCTFVGIDTETLLERSGYVGYAAPQWHWISQTLREAYQARRNHLIVFGHIPPYYHNRNELDSFWNFPHETRDKFFDIAGLYHVDAYLAGHVHENRVNGASSPVIDISDALGAAPENGYGYCYFRVEEDRITRTYVPLDQVDTIAPAPPVARSLDLPTSDSVCLAWDGGSDNTGIAGYEVYRNGTLIGRAFGDSFTAQGLPAVDEAEYRVVTRDLGGNASAAAIFQTARVDGGPFVENLTAGGAVIRWHTSRPTRGILRLGLTPGDYPVQLTDPALNREHRIAVLGLNAATRFYFTVESDLQVLAKGSANTFVTRNPGERCGARDWARYE